MKHPQRLLEELSERITNDVVYEINDKIDNLVTKTITEKTREQFWDGDIDLEDTDEFLVKKYKALSYLKKLDFGKQIEAYLNKEIRKLARRKAVSKVVNSENVQKDIMSIVNE